VTEPSPMAPATLLAVPEPDIASCEHTVHAGLKRQRWQEATCDPLNLGYTVVGHTSRK
jgi:hypothetical protein